MASRKPAIGAALTFSMVTRGLSMWTAATARASGVFAPTLGALPSGAVAPAVVDCAPGALPAAAPDWGPWAQAERLITPNRAKKICFMNGPCMGDRCWNAGKAGSFAIVSWHDRRCAPRGPAVGAIDHALGAFPPVHAGVRDAADRD